VTVIICNKTSSRYLPQEDNIYIIDLGETICCGLSL